MKDKVSQIKALYWNESLHSSVYARMAAMEKNRDLKRILTTLTAMEAKHMRLWGEVLKINGVRPSGDIPRFWTSFIILLRRIMGVALTVKLIEYFEEAMHVELRLTVKGNAELTRREIMIIGEIDRDTEQVERGLEDAVIGYGMFLKNIRDVIFGMNDGLVEILGVVVGLAAAIGNPVLVMLGGIIVAVSGTLSMGAGAYLSTEYEQNIDKAAGRPATPFKSALYVGIMYFVGSLFPLAPFALGLSGMLGIATAIVITAVVLTIVSTLISIISNTSAVSRVSKTLLVSLGIDAITILVGLYARAALGLPAGG